MFDFDWFMNSAFPLFGDLFGFISYIGSMTIGDFLDLIEGIFLVNHTIEFTNFFTGDSVSFTILAFYMFSSNIVADVSLAPLKAVLGLVLSSFSFLARGVILMFPFLELSSPLWFALIFIGFYLSLALSAVSWALKLFLVPS